MGDEIQAMGAIDKAMRELESDEAKRVLRWAVDKFGGGPKDSGPPFEDPGADGLDGGTGEGTGSFQRISDLMDAASPSTGVEYVLVASYWFQQVQGQESFNGQEVNAELKDLGHGVKNITDSFNSLIKRKPPAVRQIQKTGKSRQARKLYRLTEVGVRTVERMLRGETDE